MYKPCLLFVISIVSISPIMPMDNSMKKLTNEELESELVSRKKQEQEEALHVYTSFLDAYLNRDLEVVDQKFKFSDYNDPAVKLSMGLQEGFDFFNKVTDFSETRRKRTNRPRASDVFIVNRAVLCLLDRYLKKNFLQKNDKLEHKLILLQNLDEEDKLALNLERCKNLNRMKNVTEEEKKELQKEVQANFEYFQAVARAFNITDIDVFFDNSSKIALLREALEAGDTARINECKRTDLFKRDSINDYVSSLCVQIKDKIAIRDKNTFLASAEAKDDTEELLKHVGSECCIS